MNLRRLKKLDCRSKYNTHYNTIDTTNVAYTINLTTTDSVGLLRSYIRVSKVK
jgi:hypothetical protein